jgi:hypothetical protein
LPCFLSDTQDHALVPAAQDHLAQPLLGLSNISELEADHAQVRGRQMNEIEVTGQLSEPAGLLVIGQSLPELPLADLLGSTGGMALV